MGQAYTSPDAARRGEMREGWRERNKEDWEKRKGWDKPIQALMRRGEERCEKGGGRGIRKIGRRGKDGTSLYKP